MKVAAYVEGRMACVVHMDSIRPENGFAYGPFIDFVRERYGFQVAGLSENSQMPAFNAGEFRFDGEPAAIASLELQPSGFMIVCTKTEICEAFFSDLQKSIAENFGFKDKYDYRKILRSTIISEHTVEFDRTFGRWLELQSLLEEFSGKDERDFSWYPASFKFSGFTSNAPMQEKQFIFERRVGAGPNVWFSHGPVSTVDHMILLQKADELFSCKE